MWDIPELVTTTLAIAIAIGGTLLAHRYAYRSATEQATAQIAATFKQKIDELRNEKNNR